MNIYIIGYMGSGKTTFGKALAGELDLPFIDLDSHIEEKNGKSISQIFEQDGEEVFRELEKDAINNISREQTNAVIACGGGTPCHSGIMDILNKNGITIFLETSIPVLLSRLEEESDQRPLLAGKTPDEIRQKVLSQLCDRLPVYMEAKLKWQGDDLETAEQIEANVKNFVSSYPSVFR